MTRGTGLKVGVVTRKIASEVEPDMVMAHDGTLGLDDADECGQTAKKPGPSEITLW